MFLKHYLILSKADSLWEELKIKGLNLSNTRRDQLYRERCDLLFTWIKEEEWRGESLLRLFNRIPRVKERITELTEEAFHSWFPLIEMGLFRARHTNATQYLSGTKGFQREKYNIRARQWSKAITKELKNNEEKKWMVRQRTRRNKTDVDDPSGYTFYRLVIDDSTEERKVVPKEIEDETQKEVLQRSVQEVIQTVACVVESTLKNVVGKKQWSAAAAARKKEKVVTGGHKSSNGEILEHVQEGKKRRRGEKFLRESNIVDKIVEMMTDTMKKSTVDAIKKATGALPSNSKAWRNLGVAGGGNLKEGKYSEIKCYQEALRHDPEYSPAWLNLGSVGGGIVSERKYSSIDCYREALKLLGDVEQQRPG